MGLFDIVPQEVGEDIARNISNDKAIYVRVDITDSDAVGAAVERVVRELGNLKGVVHCAGIALKREWTNDIVESIPNFRKVSSHFAIALTCPKMLDVNVVGTFTVNAHIADAINKPLNHPDGTANHAPFWTADEERGVIVNFASAAAHPYARCLSYGPTKTAVVGITKGKPLHTGHMLSLQPCPISWAHPASVWLRFLPVSILLPTCGFCSYIHSHRRDGNDRQLFRLLHR